MKMNQFLTVFVVLAVAAIAEAYYNEEVEQHYSPHPYSFKYDVKDPHTGDVKSQYESGHDGFVHGEYSLKEADGTIRTVKYVADPYNGFNAKVYRSGHGSHSYGNYFDY